MPNCWAERLGGCVDKASREHIISAGIFREGAILVKGFPWCRNEFKAIGVSSFTKKVLCERHNNTLAHVDEAGIAAMNVFRQEVHINNARSAMKPRRWTVKKSQIDGRGLERWFLKTIINVAAEGIYKIGRDSNKIGKPSERLVKIAFGMERFKPKAGLYGLGHVGQNLNLREGVFLNPLIDTQETVVGVLFHFHGYRFLLYIEEEGLQPNIPIPSMFGEQAHRTDTLYPLKAVKINLGKHLSHVIEFDYDR
jgi:hypothetical protein